MTVVVRMVDGVPHIEALPLLTSVQDMRYLLKGLCEDRVGIKEPISEAFADREGVHIIVDQIHDVMIPWNTEDW